MNEDFDVDTAADEAVVTTLSKPKTKQAEQTATRRQPPYNVIIMNDEEHTFEYVIELLAKIFKHATKTGEYLAWTIHTQGRAIVYTTHKELAELKRDQVLAYGPDPRMSISKGPLNCYIEAAPSE